MLGEKKIVESKHESPDGGMERKIFGLTSRI